MKCWLNCVIGAYRLKVSSHSMPPSLCNKCHRGGRQTGDSWCVGCSSLELSQRLLSQGWRNPGLRQVAEEALLSSTRLVKAFHNLDLSLGQGSSGLDRDAARTTAPKVKPQRPGRSRSPTRDHRPPLPRSPRRALASGADVEEDRRRDESEESFEEEEEEEIEERREVKEEPRRSERPPEPKEAPRVHREEPKESHRGYHEYKPHKTSEKKRKRKKQRKHGASSRGGRKHQRHSRELTNPLKASHRPLRAEQLRLASSLREGLQRRH